MNDIHEKLGALTATVSAAHKRLDKVETEVRQDLKDLSLQLSELNAHMNKGKGWAGAFFLLSGLAGGGIVKLLSVIFSTKGA